MNQVETSIFTKATWQQATGWLGDTLLRVGPSIEELSFDPSLVCTDTRSIKQQGIFVAIKGERFDGHDFITPELLDKVGGVVCSSAYFKQAKSDILMSKAIVVEDTLTAYGKIAGCLLYTSPSPRDQRGSRMPSSA